MKTRNKLTTISKYMSYLLRHKPEDAELSLDKDGWCDFDKFIQYSNLDRGDVLKIVSSDEKTRFAIKEVDGREFIRANQGHSTDVDIDFRSSIPPATLYHGTTTSALPSITENGLLPVKRHYVHLSEDIVTAQKVGDRRRAGTVVLQIDSASMANDGFAFFISENGVWLVDSVPSSYITPL